MAEFKQGLKANLPNSSNQCDLLYTTDEKKLYIGNGMGQSLTELANATHALSSVTLSGKTVQQSTALNIDKGIIAKNVSGVLSLSAEPQALISGGDFVQNTKFGVNDYLLTVYADMNYQKSQGSGGGWQTGFGNLEVYSLSRIDYSFKRMHDMGIKWYREVQPVPVAYDGWGQAGGAVNPTDNDGWEAVDRIVELARKYDIKLIFCIPQPYYANNNYKTINNYITNWLTPLSTYYATRYKNDYDVIYFEPMNEINGQMVTYFTDAVNGTSIDPRWVDIQTTSYDAIKAVQPKLKVTMSSINEWDGGTAEKTINMIDQLNTAGKIAKFDSFVPMHFYARYSLVVAPNYWSNPAIPSGSGQYGDVALLKAKLDAYGRTDVLISIGEYSVVWNVLGRVSTSAGSATVTGTNTTFISGTSVNGQFNVKINAGDKVRFEGDSLTYTVQSVNSETSLTLTVAYPNTRVQVGIISTTVEQQCADATKWMYDKCLSDSNIANILYWALYGSDQSITDVNSNAIVPSGIGYKGWGLVLNDTDKLTLPGGVLTGLAKEYKTSSISRIRSRVGVSIETPAYAEEGEFLFEKDTNTLKVGKGLNVPLASLFNYTLPVASATVLGGVKVDGTTITINNGVISSASAYTLPTSSATVLGGVKVDGTTITINNGVISATASNTVENGITGSIGAGTAGQLAKYISEGTTVSGYTLQASDVTGALGYAPGMVASGTSGQIAKYNSNGTVVSGYSLQSSDITNALGFTPGNVTGPASVSAAGRIPKFNDTTGKVLADGYGVNSPSGLILLDTNSSFAISLPDGSPNWSLNTYAPTTARYPAWLNRMWNNGFTGGFPSFQLFNIGGSLASPAATQSGVTLGALLFYGGGASGATKSGAALKAVSTGLYTDADQPTALTFSTGGTSTNGNVVERMRIDGTGNVGIGVTSPASSLHVMAASGTTVPLTLESYGTGGPQIIGRYTNLNAGVPTYVSVDQVLFGFGGRPYFHDTGAFATANYGAFNICAAENLDSSHHGTYMSFKTTAKGNNSNAERMRIDDTGRVGINNNSPTYTLDVTGIVAAKGFIETASTLVGASNVFTPDATAGSTCLVNLGATNTIANPTNAPASGLVASITLIIKQDATGGRTVSWGSAYKWGDAGVPTLSSGANKTTIVTCITYDGGTTWLSFLSGTGF